MEHIVIIYDQDQGDSTLVPEEGLIVWVSQQPTFYECGPRDCHLQFTNCSGGIHSLGGKMAEKIIHCVKKQVKLVMIGHFATAGRYHCRRLNHVWWLLVGGERMEAFIFSEVEINFFKCILVYRETEIHLYTVSFGFSFIFWNTTFVSFLFHVRLTNGFGHGLTKLNAKNDDQRVKCATIHQQCEVMKWWKLQKYTSNT